MKRVKIDDGYFHHEIGVITPETRKKLAVRQKFSIFAVAMKMQRRLRAAAQRRPSELASAFTLHRSCIVNQEEKSTLPRESFYSPTGETIKAIEWGADGSPKLIRKMEARDV